MRTAAKVSQKAITDARHSAHQTRRLWALVQASVRDRPAPGRRHRGRCATWRDLPDQAVLHQPGGGAGEIIASVEMDRGLLGEGGDAIEEIERRLRQGRGMPGGGGHDRAQGNPRPVDHRGALAALFAPIDGTAARQFATAGRFGDAALDRQGGQIKADQLVIGIVHDRGQALHHPGVEPRVRLHPGSALRSDWRALG